MNKDPPADPQVPPVEQKVPPEDSTTKTPPKDDDLLSTLEKDFIAQLKDKVNLEDFAELDQKTRIRTFRALAKSLSQQTSTEKEKPKVKPNMEKGQASDPTAAAPPVDTHIPTLLERNNMKDYLHDVRASRSVYNITDRIRGKTTPNK